MNEFMSFVQTCDCDALTEAHSLSTSISGPCQAAPPCLSAACFPCLEEARQACLPAIYPIIPINNNNNNSISSQCTFSDIKSQKTSLAGHTDLWQQLKGDTRRLTGLSGYIVFPDLGCWFGWRWRGGGMTEIRPATEQKIQHWFKALKLVW